jgi:hypothetical protein
MNCKEIVAAEDQAEGSILLIREGMFWRAYERSAFALVKQVHPLKALKRAYKSLDGRELVYVGFPISSEERMLKDVRHEQHGDTMVVELKEPVDPAAFEEWKAAVPLAPDTKAPPPPPLPSDLLPGGSFPVSVVPRVATEVADRLLHFDLATSTPLAAMQFIAALQQMLKSTEKNTNHKQ